jgi:predicted nucleic acid-binding protein
VTTVAVADTGPLVHLSQVDALELLSGLDTLYVPETVVDEFLAGDRPDGLDPVPHEPVVATVPEELAPRLDPGERAALAVAVDRDATLLTDDLAAREVATEMQVDVTAPSASSSWGTARV